MQPSVQARLLRVIQEKEFSLVGGYKTINVDVRIIAATNRKLEDEINKGSFREDLFFRLNVIPIALPPLRKLKEDIPILVTHIINTLRKELHCEPTKFLAEAIEILQYYDWPGNIWELRNIIERVLSLHGSVKTILPKHLPMELLRKNKFGKTQQLYGLSKNRTLENMVACMEKDLINQALQQANGNLSMAQGY